MDTKVHGNWDDDVTDAEDPPSTSRSDPLLDQGLATEPFPTWHLRPTAGFGGRDWRSLDRLCPDTYSI
ncbi:hypothetical protein G6O67_002096 [Ophiocordyceps sinensis]|uniref:Uncharacterized protein n=1 Tax=Ophiocordyceps sinensis TaxID=72228 RepID=A0A8H4V6X8_9HYPO|nr:hypothetical protein G6O67_002096 [Ophiocordyceps sinensis]